MADSSSSSQATFAPGHPIEDNGPAQGFKAVGDAMMELNIARKNMLIYPAHHEQARRSLKRACAAIRESVGCFAPLTITVLQPHITILVAGALNGLCATTRPRGNCCTRGCVKIIQRSRPSASGS